MQQSYFKATFNSPKMTLNFSEVSGLTREIQAMASPPTGAGTGIELKLSGGTAICTGPIQVFVANVRAGKQVPTDVLLEHIDAKGAVLQRWTLQGAKVTQAVTASLKATGNEVALTALSLHLANGDALKGGGSHW